jgi:AcrR family transcriptional regulator
VARGPAGNIGGSMAQREPAVTVEATENRELRSRLLDAGRAVFAEVGYGGATVDDVIERAATSRATFYRYFRNKNDLFVELSRACFEDMNAIVEDLGQVKPGPNDVGEIEQLLRRYRELHARHSGVFRAWWERSARLGPDVQAEQRVTFGRLVESLTRLMMDANAPSKVDPEVRAALLYLLVEGSYFAVTSRWSRIDPDDLAPTLAAMVHRTYLGGTATTRTGRLRLG